jgi:hypothetical protein
MVGFIGYVIIIILITILIFTRNIHEFTMPGVARDADGYFHMVIAREFRENGHHVPKNISVGVFDWPFSYPYLVHFLLSFLPEGYYESVDRVFPTVMDLLYVGLLTTLVPLGFLDIQDFPLVLALFVTTPQFVQYAGGKGLSARKPGIILGTLSFLSFVVWSSGGNDWILFASIFFAGLTHLTSKFGTQTIVFFYIGFAIFYPIALLLVIGSFIIATVLSKGRYIKILRTHLRFSYDFAVRKQFVFLYNGFKSIDTFRQFLNARKPTDVLAVVYDSVLLKAFLNNPYAIGVVVVILWSYQTSVLSIPAVLLMWFGLGFVACGLTTLYGLRFLGQPGRYLNYTFIPGTLIIIDGFGALSVDNHLFIISLLMMGIAMLIGQALAYKRLAPSLEELEAFDQAIEYLNSNNADRVLTQPRHLGAEIAWKAPESSVGDSFGEWWSTQLSNKIIRDIFVDDPLITNNITILERHVNPSKVVFYKRSISEDMERCLVPPDSEPRFENKYYSIYCWSQFEPIN